MRLMLSDLVLFAAVALATPAAFGGPVTIGFDDIDATLSDVPVGNPYGGLNWTNFSAYTAVPGFPGFNSGIVSGPNAAYSGGEIFDGGVAAVIGTISALPGQSFDLLTAYLGAGYYNNLALTVTGLRGGVSAYTETVTLNTNGASLFTFDFSGVDALKFSAARSSSSTDPYACGDFDCTLFTIDDIGLVINDAPPPPVSDVPEPASLVLAATALAAVMLTTWRRRRSAPR